MNHLVFSNGLKCDVNHSVFSNGLKCDVNYLVFYNGLKCDVNPPVFSNGLKCDVNHPVFSNGLKCDVNHPVFYNGLKCDVNHPVFYNGLKCDVNHPVFYNGLQFLDHKLSGCESSHSWHWRGGVRGQLPWILKQAGLWRIKGGSLHIQNIKYMMNTSLKGKNWKILEKKYSPSHIPLIIPLHPPPPVPQLVMPWRPVTCLG